MNDIKTILEGIELSKTKTDGNISAFEGQKDGEQIIVITKSIADGSIPSAKDLTAFKKTFDNQRYYKYQGISSIEKEITVIYPALPPDIRKYGSIERKLVVETPDIYQTEVYPKILNQDLTWVKNILEKKCEVEDIIYEDDVFVLLPDLQWDAKDMDKVYCLAILKDPEIRSIRDLRNDHISILGHIDNQSKKVMEERYGVSNDQVRSYFHYRPSFWHSHIHFNLITNRIGGATIDTSVSVFDVIRNLKLDSDYYKNANMLVLD